MSHSTSKPGRGDTAKFKRGLNALNRIGQPKSENGQRKRNAVEGETSHPGLPMLESKSKGRPKRQSDPIDQSAAKKHRTLRDA